METTKSDSVDIRSFIQSILPFDLIVRNPQKHAESEITHAKQKIRELLRSIRLRNEQIVDEINDYIVGRIDSLLVYSFQAGRLIVAGSRDFSYYHHLEIIFDNVFYLSGLLGEWCVPYPEKTFEIDPIGPEPDVAKEEYGQFFVFHHDVPEGPLVIGASMVSFNTDTVYYYERENLKEDERICIPYR